MTNEVNQSLRLLLVSVLVACLCSPLSAQGWVPAGRAKLQGSVRTPEGGSVRRADVCATSNDRRVCAAVDSTGVYELTGLPNRPIVIEVTCDVVLSLPFYRVLASDTVRFAMDSVIHRDWRVSNDGCDQRIIRHVPGIFRGHYTAGFEESDFIPCPADAWFQPGDSLQAYQPEARGAWVSLSEGVNWPSVPPDTLGNNRGSAEYYVVIRGTVVGPKPSGHLGVWAFELVVDSILEMRLARERDCRPGGH